MNFEFMVATIGDKNFDSSIQKSKAYVGKSADRRILSKILSIIKVITNLESIQNVVGEEWTHYMRIVLLKKKKELESGILYRLAKRYPTYRAAVQSIIVMEDNSYDFSNISVRNAQLYLRKTSYELILDERILIDSDPSLWLQLLKNKSTYDSELKRHVGKLNK